MNNPVIQKFELIPYQDYYQGLIKLFPKWAAKNKKRMPMAKTRLDKILKPRKKTLGFTWRKCSVGNIKLHLHKLRNIPQVDMQCGTDSAQYIKTDVLIASHVSNTAHTNIGAAAKLFLGDASLFKDYPKLLV